jgi:hypothetical protein
MGQMISANRANLSYPLDTTQLFWIAPARDAAGPYNPSCFYFASPDGARLVPAMLDETRFLAALSDAITTYAGYSFVPGLQQIYDALTADLTPPAPRYPSAGDTGVKGEIMQVFTGAFWTAQQSPTPPTGWQDPIWNGTEWVSNPWIATWRGLLTVAILANGYSTPPATLQESGTPVMQKWMRFKATSAVVCGPCRFDIEEGTDQNGNPSGVLVARNVINT